MSLSTEKRSVAFIKSTIPDSGLYYYIPRGPQVTLLNTSSCQDEASQKKDPNLAFNFYAISKEHEGPEDEQELKFGIFQFAAQLHVTQEEAEKEAREQHLNAKQLLPLQPIKASLNISLPDIISPSMIPAAVGDKNVSLFSKTLFDQEKILLLTNLLENPDSTPLGLCYKIDYLAQMPPSKFEIKAKYAKVYDYLKVQFGFNLLIVKADFENIYEKLNEEKIVEVTIVDGGGNFDKAINEELTEILLTEFFKPTYQYPPVPESKPKFGFYLQKVSVQDKNFGSLSAKINETSVVQRSVFPMNTFGQFVSNSCYLPKKIIHKHEIDDNFFKYRTIDIYLLEDKVAKGINAIKVDLDYNNKKTQVIFTSENWGKHTFKEPAEQKVNGDMVWPVNYQFTIYFNQPGLAINAVSSPQMVTEADNLLLNLDSILTETNFQGQVFPGFNWDWFSNIMVDLIAYNNNGDMINKQFQLDQQTPFFDNTWLLPQTNEDQFRYKATFTYQPKIDRHLPGPIEQAVDQLLIAPLAAYPQRQLTLTQEYDWNKLKQVLVVLEYPYSDNSSWTQDFLFNKDAPSSQLFSADQPNPEFKTIQLKVTIYPKTGDLIVQSYSSDQDTFQLPKTK